MKLVVLESMLLFFIGLIPGFLAGMAISGYLEVNPIVFTGDDAKAFTESGFAPYYVVLLMQNSFGSLF